MQRPALMRAAVLVEPKRLEIRELPRPAPGPNEVRLRVEGCGVCASSLPPWEGRPWFAYPFQPGHPGHEGWGVIDAMGREVVGLSEGMRVAALSYGAFAEYDIARADAVVPLPKALDDVPFPGEALGCGMNIFRRAAIRAGESVAIIGMGFLGAIVAKLCVSVGARVIAISKRQSSLALAKRASAAVCVPWTDSASVAARVMEETSGQGASCVIEAVGEQSAIDLATDIVAVRGRIVIAGYHQDGPRHVDMQRWNWRGIDVINAHERDPAVYVRGIRDAIDAVLEDRLDPKTLVSHRFELTDIDQAFATLASRPEGFVKAWVSCR